MNTFPFPQRAQIKNQIDPMTYTNIDINKEKIQNYLLEENDKISKKEELNQKNNLYKDLEYEGQKTNELKNIVYEQPKEEINNEKNILKMESNNEEGGEEGQEGEDDKIGTYYYNGDLNQEYEDNEKYYDDYYYISEYIPPQNFSKKLKNIKLKYEKLKKEIEWLKKENKKYNPNFILRNYKINQPFN